MIGVLADFEPKSAFQCLKRLCGGGQLLLASLAGEAGDKEAVLTAGALVR
jgi:hypothetical protein